MAKLVDIKVPDIGDFTDVDVVEVMVKPGDRVNVEDSLITIESDKATMEVPAPIAGVVKELRVKLGDKVSEGSVILALEAQDGAEAQAAESAPPQVPAPQPKPDAQAKPGAPAPAQAANHAETPKPVASSRLAALAKSAAAHLEPESAPKTQAETAAPARSAAPARALSPVAAPAAEIRSDTTPKPPHASPSVRKFARELGVDLEQVHGSGMHSRIFRTDIEQYVKRALAEPAKSSVSGATAFDIAPWPKVDFARYGAIESRPLSRIRRASRTNLARNWVMIPHVTQFDDADVTELEELRKEINLEHSSDGVRVTILAFVMKALVAALNAFPEFNSSLDGDHLILKKYFNFGFAADTPDGLVVPVVREVDKKGVLQIARETADLATAAREGKLKPADIQGGCFTVSSLGGIGGTAFTPIINAPEVAILGVSKLATKPVYRDGAFVPRLMLPLSLSYDHRVIDGAAAARFITYLGKVLADMRRALL